jgi:hypothetical protein
VPGAHNHDLVVHAGVRSGRHGEVVNGGTRPSQNSARTVL